VLGHFHPLTVAISCTTPAMRPRDRDPDLTDFASSRYDKPSTVPIGSGDDLSHKSARPGLVTRQVARP
jgi:hypothetical protein